MKLLIPAYSFSKLIFFDPKIQDFDYKLAVDKVNFDSSSQAIVLSSKQGNHFRFRVWLGTVAPKRDKDLFLTGWFIRDYFDFYTRICKLMSKVEMSFQKASNTAEKTVKEQHEVVQDEHNFILLFFCLW